MGNRQSAATPGAAMGCPRCGETVGVSVLAASRVGVSRNWMGRLGLWKDGAGVVRDCVGCGARYTACADGRTIALRGPGPAVAGAESRAGGAGDGKGRAFDDDLGTLDGGPL